MGTLVQFPHSEPCDDGDNALLPRRSQLANALLELGPLLERLRPQSTVRMTDAYGDLERAVRLVVDGYIELVRSHLQHPVEIGRIVLRHSNGEINADEAADHLVKLNKAFHAELLNFGNRVMSDTWKEQLAAGRSRPSS